MEVLKNGNDKEFIAVCNVCKSTLIYNLKDVQTKDNGELKNSIKCSVCTNTVLGLIYLEK